MDVFSEALFKCRVVGLNTAHLPLRHTAEGCGNYGDTTYHYFHALGSSKQRIRNGLFFIFLGHFQDISAAFSSMRFDIFCLNFRVYRGAVSCEYPQGIFCTAESTLESEDFLYGGS